MKKRLSIEFRHKQLYKDKDILQPVIVVCNPDGTATYQAGTVPNAGWLDVTEDTEGLEDFNLSWSARNGDTDGEFGSNYQKGLTGDLRFSGAAFQFIFDWLMTEPCQMLNAVEARVYDHECKKYYRPFELKLDNTEYSPGEEPCIVSMPLREKDDTWHSFQKTIIEDNWQNWFNRTGTSTKDHPTFPFIVEKKPKFFLAITVVLIYIVGMLSVGVLVGLNAGKRWIRKALGFTYFCPAPLLRTYIENICSKYGYTADTIFDDLPGNPYRDTCLFYPVSQTWKNFDSFPSPSTKFIWENRTVLSFAKFLDQLKKVFNAEWYVTPNNQLVFKHKSFFDTQAPIYDFTAAGADKLYFLKYSFNGNKKPAYGDYAYQIDPQDTCSNESKWRYNSIVDFDGPQNNPMLEGKVQKSFDFASTSFHNDGTTLDFLEEAVKMGRLVAVGALLIGMGQLFLAANFITVAIVVGLLAAGYNITNEYVNDFFDNSDLNGMVRVASSEINIPRLLLWDRTTPLDQAKVVTVEDPAQNPYYNLDAVDYYTEHPAFDAPAGYFGTDVRKIHNYPLFVEEKFTGNLWDRFHEYDNPLKNGQINQDWSGEVDLCCEWLDRLGVWEGDYAKIGGVLVLENRFGRLIKGRIDNFEPSNKTGRIILKGKVIT